LDEEEEEEEDREAEAETLELEAEAETEPELLAETDEETEDDDDWTQVKGLEFRKRAQLTEETLEDEEIPTETDGMEMLVELDVVSSPLLSLGGAAAAPLRTRGRAPIPPDRLESESDAFESEATSVDLAAAGNGARFLIKRWRPT
jgi:hypothetical protein